MEVRAKIAGLVSDYKIFSQSEVETEIACPPMEIMEALSAFYLSEEEEAA